jgi:hypothetical protein
MIEQAHCKNKFQAVLAKAGITNAPFNDTNYKLQIQMQMQMLTLEMSRLLINSLYSAVSFALSWVCPMAGTTRTANSAQVSILGVMVGSV